MRIPAMMFAAALLWSGAEALAAEASGFEAALQSSLAGEWRANADKPGGACGPDASEGDTRFTLEFAVTGGTFAFDDGSEDARSLPVKSVTESNRVLKIAFVDGSAWSFTTDAAHKTLQSDAPPDRWQGAQGLTFHFCRAPADRSAIKLSKEALEAISSAMPPAHAIFVDARAKGGCKALDYQYLTIDLVGPLGFTLGRWNSMHLAERLVDGKKAPIPVDEVSNWTIDAAEAVANGYKLKITELIPPNGSRGDTTTITLAPTIDGRASIPEWQRTYMRCAEGDLAAE